MNTASVLRLEERGGTGDRPLRLSFQDIILRDSESSSAVTSHLEPEENDGAQLRSVYLFEDQRRDNQQVLDSFNSWLEDTSGYDERAWPEIKKGLEASRTSSRALFGE